MPYCKVTDGVYRSDGNVEPKTTQLSIVETIQGQKVYFMFDVGFVKYTLSF